MTRSFVVLIALLAVSLLPVHLVAQDSRSISTELQRALEEVRNSVNRRDKLESERKNLLEDFPPTHAKVKAVEKLILDEGVLYAGYADQAYIHLGTEIEAKNKLVKEYLAEGMRADGKAITEVQALIAQLTQQKGGYINAFKPETYADTNLLFAGMKRVDLSAVKRTAIEIKGVTYTFCWCPPGTFTMGSPNNEEGRYDNETPHQVTLRKGFWMLETEVTQEMWESIMGNNPSNFKGAKLPVEQVSWDDCQEFIQKLNRQTKPVQGMKFALPTEAQWEYACRAGTTSAFNGGSDKPSSLDALGWYDRNSNSKTHEVGLKIPNSWGLYDMHGNVFEWCSDWYDDYPSGSVTDPIGSANSSSRVPRGGGWSYSAKVCRSADRGRNDPSLRLNDLGVRISLVSE